MVPPVPPNLVFGPFNFEREPVQMARCITADLLPDRYGVEVEPGSVYSPDPYWWLLVTASRVGALVNPQKLLLCLESLRTSTTENLILCFHLFDWYRGKVKFRWLLELIIKCFTSYPRIRLLDEWIHTFEEPLHIKAAMSTLDTWVRANVDNQALPRSLWQDLAAVPGRIPRVCLPSDNGPGRELVYPGSQRADMVEYISYDTTDFLQVEGHIALACSADLETSSSSAALRATCLRKLIAWLEDKGIAQIHFPMLDPQRPVYSLANLYRAVMYLFTDTNIHVVIHNCVYVSILGIEGGVRPPECHLLN